MSRYKDIIDNLRNLYVAHVTTRLVVTDVELRERGTAGVIQGKMDFDMTQAISKVVRKSVSEDPRVHSTIYENDIFVIVDPSAFFKQLDEELEGAYTHGNENGLRFAEQHRRNRGPYIGTD